VSEAFLAGRPVTAAAVPLVREVVADEEPVDQMYRTDGGAAP
jgi:hypothetical protein